MEVRADTYLWAIRMYKSRTLAAEAIKGGKVKTEWRKLKALSRSKNRRALHADNRQQQKNN